MNLTADLSQMIDQLEPIARPGGVGRVLMIMGAGPGAGASTLARELARLAAQRSQRGVWLFDLDVAGNAQARAARVQGAAFDAGFGRTPFWTVSSEGGQARLVARQSVMPNLFVSEFQQAEGTRARVGLRRAPDYWAAVRQSVDLAIIDAPGTSRAPASLAPDMDGVILVSDAQNPNPEGLLARRQAIESRGGVVAGLIVNRAGSHRSAA